MASPHWGRLSTEGRGRRWNTALRWTPGILYVGAPLKASVFNTDIEMRQETCRACDEAVRIVEDPLVIQKIPYHLNTRAKAQKGSALSERHRAASLRQG